MSFFPPPYLARLQDLKLWQGNYDVLLQKQIPNSLDTIEGISGAVDTEGLSGIDTASATSLMPKDSITNKFQDWDIRTISPAKPFEELLEEKLKEDQPLEVKNKPKKPYLRKGSGLVRYNLYNPAAKPDKSSPTGTKCQKKGKQNQNSQRNSASSKKSNTSQNSPKPVNSQENSPPISPKYKNCFNNIPEIEIGLQCNLRSSLKIPDIINKPKATWNSIMSNKNTEDVKAKPYNNILQSLNHLVVNSYIPENPKSKVFNNSSHLVDLSCSNNIPITKTAFDNSDKDLKIFETLEERVEHSSFSSNNSSIMRLLSSTPQKVKVKPTQSPIVEENGSAGNNDPKLLNEKSEGLNQKQLALHDFLCNLRKIVDDKDIVEFDSASDKKNSPNTSSENWSSNTDTRGQSPSSFYTDFENAFKNTRSAAVNTSFNKTSDQTVQYSSECENCEQLQNKLDKLLKDLPDIQAEKAKVCDFAKELEKKKDELRTEISRLKNKYEESIYDLRKELHAEKKKYEREKAVFDMYVKESRNRPSRQEREELANLKRELIDTRELLKLKETKNGATQARLRTQIKQLEKEKMELKNSVENLQKENAKLKASKQLSRPSEVKMLHEINKNLTKLTSETLKNQLNKSTQNELKEEVKSRATHIENGVSKSSGDWDMENTELEKQYENAFGQLETHFRIPKQNGSSLSDSKPGKIEKVFPDGSKEIKYSNGNTKTISPDGNIIIIQFYNGDIKETNLAKNILKYYYVENATWHTQFGDGTELLEFSNGQKEKKFVDGRKEVSCSDGTFMTKLPDGTEEVTYPDGSKLVKHTNGDKIILLPNGQKEIHNNEHKRREYPNGTIKIVYPDGTQETRYPSGRIRIKDPNGILIMDK